MLDDERRGRLVDAPIDGLDYATSSIYGLTSEGGWFRFRTGDHVTLSIGSLALGTITAKEAISSLDLGAGPSRGEEAMVTAGVTNRTRLLQGLCGNRDGAQLSAAQRDRLDRLAGEIDFDLDVDEFASSEAVVTAIAETGGAGLPSAAAARNHLRRAVAGIERVTDVRIPVRDGSYLLADVFRPATGEPQPAILRMSVYGKAFGTGTACSDADRERYEQAEDRWFVERPRDLPPMVRYCENGVSANAFDWVPRGYVVVRIDPRGVGHTPGDLQPFSRQEAEDYFDAVEWVAAQPWCNGRVGLLGASYAATNQWNVATLQPPSLAAMIPFASDADGYRDLAFPGGIFHEGYRRAWWGNVTSLQCRPPTIDAIDHMRSHPFDDPAVYGPDGSGPLSADLARVRVPFLTAVSQTAVLHARAGFEAFNHAASAHKQLIVVDANYFSFLYRECLDEEFRFFDRFLKDLPVAADPAVRLMVRTGAGEYEWRDEKAWPVPGTRYDDWFLDAATPSATEADRPSFTLTAGAPVDAGLFTYAADVDAFDNSPRRARFVSAPVAHGYDLGGHVTASLWVSSSSHDMDVFVSLRVLDAAGDEVHYPVRDRRSEAPLTWGCLKVSQRAVDPERSGIRPWHTHREADRQLLEPGEVVPIDVELMPATGRIPAGARFVLDVEAVEGRGGFINAQGAQAARAYDERYHRGALNTVHTGPDHPSVVRLPVMPATSAANEEARVLDVGSRLRGGAPS
jgi:predicted acyl esterase